MPRPKPNAAGCFNGPQIVRLMLPEGLTRPGREGYAVCVGTEKPKRRCEWAVVEIHLTEAKALEFRDKLDPKDGRAVVRLGYSRLVVVDRTGRVVQDNEAEDKLLG